jgi:tripartite-type tricarboxylate transporter receptor subunit TctC
LQAIAIGSESHMQRLPQVPTFAESGLPALDIRIGYGLLAFPATPRRAIKRANIGVD